MKVGILFRIINPVQQSDRLIKIFLNNKPGSVGPVQTAPVGIFR